MSFKELARLSCLALLFACGIPAVADDDALDGPVLQPIVLTLFLHDQLSPAERASIGPDHMEWFLKELYEVTGRRTSVITVLQKPGYTDFAYQRSDTTAVLEDWQGRVTEYIRSQNLPASIHRHKYILVTRDKIRHDTLGLAFPEHGVAIASLQSYAALAHEIGHLLGATHENAYTSLASGLPCRTLMYPKHSALFPNCYAFSAENRQAIQDYFKDEERR